MKYLSMLSIFLTLAFGTMFASAQELQNGTIMDKRNIGMTSEEMVGECRNMGKRPRMCTKLPMSEDGIVRLSKIEVYPLFLDEYMKYAIEVGEISLRTEPGVLTMYAVSEKENPCRITILETYANQEAYKKHIESAHFQKYKQGTLHMVKSLILSDQTPLNSANRIMNFIQFKSDKP